MKNMQKREDLPGPELLRQVLRYEPDTGELFWLLRPATMFADGKQSADKTCAIWNGKHAHRKAFTTKNTGYLSGSVFGKACFAHRVIWAIVTGAWPENEIDHINRNGEDNRWVNLREASRSENMRNTRLGSHNTSGAKGVYWDKRSGKWLGQICADKKQHRVGLFPTFDAAVAAVNDARKKLHGDFGVAK